METVEQRAATQRAWIDGATLEQLLLRWRRAPTGDSMLQGEVGDHFAKVMFAKRDADPEEWTRVSKKVGW